MPLSILVSRASQPCPTLSERQARALLNQHYGLDGGLQALGSQQDLNFRLDSDQGRYVLKVCHGSYSAVELEAQHAALGYLRERGVPVPAVRAALSGEQLLSLEIDGQGVRARLLEYIDGQTLTRLKHLPPRLVAELGALCARVDRVLADFSHPGLTRTLQWDPQHAQALIAHLVPVLADGTRKQRVQAAAASAQQALAEVQAQLPMQAVHLDLTDDNAVWQRDGEREWQLQGVIDFGDLVHTWRIADLSVTCAALLHHAEGDPLRILPAVAAYHALNPLNEAELKALWPLIVARAAVLVLSSEQQVSVEPGNEYIRDNLAHEWEIFEVADSVPFALMEAAIFQAVGLEAEAVDLRDCTTLLPDLDGQAVGRVDLGVLSEHFIAGNWEVPGFDQQLLLQHPAPAATQYGQYRLSRTHIDNPCEPDTFALQVELHLVPGTPLLAPFPGTWRVDGPNRGSLQGAQLSLLLWGCGDTLADGQTVEGGQPLGQSGDSLTVQLCRVPGLHPPAFVVPSRAKAWQAVCPSPAALLGFDCDAAPLPDPLALLERRDASFARSQKHYYQQPPQIERGWRNYLIDLQGRSYLDMLNNVAVLGHGHPRMVSEAAKQWSLLNTNSRFHYAAIAEFSERLLALAPKGMERVFLVNSATEANDLVVRLAWAASGRRDMLSVREA